MKSLRLFGYVVVPAGLLALVVLPLLSGCGGGDKKVTVTVKPSKKTGGTTAGGAASSGTGKTPAAGGFGTFKGKVVFEGAAPTLSPLFSKGAKVKDAAVCTADAIPNESLLVGPGGGVRNVFIYLAKAPKGVKVPAIPTEKAVWDQKGCRFLPHCLIMRVNQTVNVKSGDPIAHNTHTYPKREAGFNAVVKASDRVGVDYAFEIAEFEPLEVKCDFHTWMIGYQLPLKHNFAALTNANGEFEIPDLPSGVHKFQVWHESAQGHYLYRNLKVTIEGGKTTTRELKYPAAKLVSGYQPAAKSVKLSALIGR